MVVLSNNDGCAVARSNEVKALGVKMGEPWFRLRELAQRHGLTPTRLALAYVASRGFVTSTIIGATTMEQLRENIDGCLETLSADLVDEIEALHLRYCNPAP